MPQASRIITIHAPAITIWQKISDFGAAGWLLAGVVSCTVNGVGVGAVRTLNYLDGSTIVERMTVLDKVAQRLSYTLLTDTPFGNCMTTMALHDLGPFQAQLVWSANFQLIGIPANEAVELMEGALATNCLALKQFMEAGWH